MEPHVKVLLREIALREGLDSSFCATVNTDVKGKSFHGVVTPVVLEDNFKRVSLVVKQCHTDGLTRDVQKTHDKFSNEVLFYREVVGRISGYGLLPRLPKYYGSILTEFKETIVLEDLREDSFLLKPLSDGLDMAHFDVVAKALARLHDTSLKWKDQDPSSFWQTLNSFKETFFVSHGNPESQKLATLLFEHALRAGLSCVSPKLGKRCSDYIRNVMLDRLDEMGEWIKPLNEERFTTILHGDAWCHNMLFKYNSNGDPVDVALIDWQMVRLGSPALDLIECFLSSADTSTLGRPMDFVESYAEARGLQTEQLMMDFPRWGRPGLLLAITIVVNVMALDDSTIADKFVEALKSDCIDGALRLETRSRLRGVLRTALSLGLFMQ